MYKVLAHKTLGPRLAHKLNTNRKMPKVAFLANISLLFSVLQFRILG